jgi:hypothetical protein
MSEEIQPAPEPVMKGRFNLYETPDGGYHIAYQKDGEENIEHIDVPGFVINGAKMFAESGMSFKDMLKFGMEARRAGKE